MGKATGVFLILAGVGTAALVLPTVDKDAERQLAEVVGIATRGVQHAPPAVPLATKAVTAVAVPVPVAGAQPAASKPILAATDTMIPPVLIAPPQMVVRNSTGQSARAADADARAELSREIQRELKRVGCYEGELTGEWSSATRRAMKSFIDRVNAALPIDEPDHILRTMVQGHPGAACGKGCPAGQSLANDGRCQPAVINAQKLAPRNENGSETAALAKVAVPKAAGQAQVESSKVAARSVAVPKPAWETTVAAAPQQPLPGAEGRMAVGGPQQAAAIQTGSIAGSNAGSNAGATTAGPRTPRAATETSGAVNSNEAVLPGAIAALATGAAAVALAPKPEQRPSREQAVRTDGSSSKRAAVSGNSDNTGARDKDTEPAKTDKKPEAKPEAKPEVKAEQPARPRQQQVARRPEPYKYPLPYFVGVQVPKVFSGAAKPERSNFNVRIYERFSRELR